MIAICQHCHQGKVSRPRQLCWTCFYAPGVRDQYPTTSKFARRGEGHFTAPPLECEPTTASPGTREKLEVLAQRARMRQRLWHPMDADFPGDPKPLALLMHERRERKVA